MHFFTVCLFFFLLLVSESAINTFDKFKKFFQKVYQSGEEEAWRKLNFNSSIERVKELNLKKPKMKFGINQFSDLSDEEWKNLFPIREEPLGESGEGIAIIQFKQPFFNGNDWRKKIGEWPAQNQGKNCNSCWAFAAIAAVEAQYSIHNRTKTSLNLSKQEIVDCANKYVDNQFDSKGCGTGWDTDGYRYMRIHGVVEEELYSYTGNSSSHCKRNENNELTLRYKIGGYKQMSFNQTDEKIMSLLVEKGPLSANMLALHEEFRNYKGGLIRDLFPWERRTNHAVLIVGYGHDAKEKADYWIIRNSWGRQWGEDGYARVERGYNQMGINVFVAFVWL